jgi:putative integral membrane protein (TIGR02587 family)
MFKSAKDERPLNESLQEYLRGTIGGVMFSLPLIYTMEVWWAGFILHPFRLFIYVLVTFTLLLGYNRYAGLRRDASRLEVVIDSVEEIGIGLLVAAAFLWLLGRINPEMTLHEIIGKITIEAMTVAIGVSVGTAQLGGSSTNDTGMKGEKQDSGPPAPNQENIDFWAQVVISLCGAVLFAANVAPTEEILMIGVEISSERLLMLAIISMIFGGLILFYSNFIGAERFTRTRSAFTIISGTIITYAVALISSTAILWFFGRLDDVAPITSIAQIVVLALPATLGASAGRLLLQGSSND